MLASLRFLFYFSPQGQLGVGWEVFWELRKEKKKKKNQSKYVRAEKPPCLTGKPYAGLTA